MTISTRRTNPAAVSPSRPLAGFTLVEVMISATLSALILAGVMSAFLMLGRTGLAAGAYSEMDNEVRRGLEVFGEEARRASGIHWNSSQSVTLTLVTSGTGTSLVTYAYDPDPASATFGCFYRVVGDVTSTLPRRVLVHGVASDFTFQRYKLTQPGVADATAVTDLETKRLNVVLRAKRLGGASPEVTQSAVSATYILRNKRVAN